MSKHLHPRQKARVSRKARVRKRVQGSAERPRLSVYRSLKVTYAQIISDETGTVLAAVSSRECIAEGKSTKAVESAKEVGKKIAQLAKEKSITKVVFDRNGYLYHGRVAAVADGAREAGLEF